jgi:hypothetical protein
LSPKVPQQFQPSKATAIASKLESVARVTTSRAGTNVIKLFYAIMPFLGNLSQKHRKYNTRVVNYGEKSYKH